MSAFCSNSNSSLVIQQKVLKMCDCICKWITWISHIVWNFCYIFSHSGSTTSQYLSWSWRMITRLVHLIYFAHLFWSVFYLAFESTLGNPEHWACITYLLVVLFLGWWRNFPFKIMESGDLWTPNWICDRILSRSGHLAILIWQTQIERSGK